MLSPPGGMRTECCGHIAQDPTNQTSGDMKEPEKQEGGRRGREIGRERRREMGRKRGKKGGREGERDTKNQ